MKDRTNRKNRGLLGWLIDIHLSGVHTRS